MTVPLGSLGLWMLVVRRGTAFVPTMAQTEAGFYLASEPVFVAPISDPKAVEAAVLSAIRSGNPRIPTPDRSSFKEYVLLKHAGVRSLSAFDRLAEKWKIEKHNGRFLICPYKPAPGRGFLEDKDREESVPDSASVEEAVHRLVQRATQRP